MEAEWMPNPCNKKCVYACNLVRISQPTNTKSHIWKRTKWHIFWSVLGRWNFTRFGWLHCFNSLQEISAPRKLSNPNIEEIIIEKSITLTPAEGVDCSSKKMIVRYSVSLYYTPRVIASYPVTSKANFWIHLWSSRRLFRMSTRLKIDAELAIKGNRKIRMQWSQQSALCSQERERIKMGVNFMPAPLPGSFYSFHRTFTATGKETRTSQATCLSRTADARRIVRPADLSQTAVVMGFTLRFT